MLFVDFWVSAAALLDFVNDYFFLSRSSWFSYSFFVFLFRFGWRFLFFSRSYDLVLGKSIHVLLIWFGTSSVISVVRFFIFSSIFFSNSPNFWSRFWSNSVCLFCKRISSIVKFVSNLSTVLSSILWQSCLWQLQWHKRDRARYSQIFVGHYTLQRSCQYICYRSHFPL